MKKILISVLLAASLLTGCGNSSPQDEAKNALSENNDVVASVNDEYNHTELCKINRSFEDIIAESHCVVRVKFDSCIDDGEYYKYTFLPIEILKDTTNGAISDEISVRYKKDDSNSPCFTEGEYVLPLIYANSVYFDAPIFAISSNTVISYDKYNENVKSISIDGIMQQTSKSTATATDFSEYIKSIEDRSESLDMDYITSTSLDDLVQQSDYIVKAVIDHDPLRSGKTRGIYTCNLVQSYKGNIDKTFEAVFTYDSVEVGKEYYFFLTKPDDNSAIYIVSSKNSIYDSDNADITEALENNGIM